MKKKPKNPEYSSDIFIKALQLDGIEEVYLDPPTVTAPEPEVSDPVVATKVKPSAEAQSIKEAMIKLREQALACTLCSELSSTRKNVVFGTGNLKADLMFVGEAPGRDEDEQGFPFVGRAGQLLTKVIESIGLSRKQVFIANTLKCRPPKNRPPQPDEITNCNPFLMKQIEIIKPKVICALGKFAAQTLLQSETPISRLRGQFHDFHGTKLMPTYHPAYLLRNPAEKKTVWQDMQLIRDELKRLKA